MTIQNLSLEVVRYDDTQTIAKMATDTGKMTLLCTEPISMIWIVISFSKSSIHDKVLHVCV